ncbi:UDP-glucose 4-epimerase [subsurface metagenome]
MTNVLITGGAGYIGSVLVRLLLFNGYRVRVLDNLKWGGESLIGVYTHPNFEFVRGDIREEQDVTKALADINAVIHLAAIVGDPACSKQPRIAEDTNWKASKMLFDLCQETKMVKRFIFSSTCSNYGKMAGDGYLSEESPLSPVSLYAELKVKFEKYMLKNKTRTDFIPTPLRFATAYGLSPRMRFDLTVNEFIREVTLGNAVEIYGGQFWRPYCYVGDIARACMLVLKSDAKKVDLNVYNVGDTSENYQKKMIAEEILKVIPGAKFKYVPKDEDPRDYRVDFSKIKNELEYNITKTVHDGIKEIHLMLKDGLISEPFAPKYKNI